MQICWTCIFAFKIYNKWYVWEYILLPVARCSALSHIISLFFCLTVTPSVLCVGRLLYQWTGRVHACVCMCLCACFCMFAAHWGCNSCLPSLRPSVMNSKDVCGHTRHSTQKSSRPDGNCRVMYGLDGFAVLLIVKERVLQFGLV